MRTARVEKPWGAMSVASRRPHPALRHLIAGYRGFALRTTRSMERIETPVALPALFIGFAAPVSLRPVATTEHRKVLAPIVYGPCTSAMRIVPPSDYKGVQVLLTPNGAARLLGPRMSEFADSYQDATEVLGQHVASLPERLSSVDSWSARFDVLDAEFRTVTDTRHDVPQLLWSAWKRLLDSRGTLRIDRLAAEVGWSQRRLELAFRRYIGLTPKATARMTRFRRVVRLLTLSSLSSAHIAAECGYYDQAHLLREFRSVTGTSPLRFRSARATFYPVGDLGPAAEVASTVVESGPGHARETRRGVTRGR